MSSILSVSQLNRYISLKIGGDLKLKNVTVRGELSDFKIHYKSGHAYFSLKDENSLLKGVMFARSAGRLGFMPQSGMSVICSGSIEVYEPSGVYQIIATEMFPAGIGAKFMQLNAVKEKLSKQGIFAAERKKQLPALPKKIAAVTSLGGAALQDVINILKRRYPVGTLEVYSAQVQGEAAAATIAEALKKADASGVDVIILARGGGSFEDLMPFNTEEVALAVAACKTPVISAVGHETDTTLADYAADVRAPTPSAAAEICAPLLENMKAAVDEMLRRLNEAFISDIDGRVARFAEIEKRLENSSPLKDIEKNEKVLDDTLRRLNTSYKKILNCLETRLEKKLAALRAMDPYKVLERGYAITLKNGAAVTKVEQLSEGDEVTIRFKDFAVTAKITGCAEINEV